MGILPVVVIASILILGTVGLFQEVDATHKYDEGMELANRHPGVAPYCTNTYVNWEQYTPFIILDVNPVLHDNCVITLEDNVTISGAIYNYGTLIIKPSKSPVVSRVLIENHGTIIIKPIPSAPQEEQKEYHEDFISRWGGLFTGYGEPPPPPKEWKNFVNIGTIINYGYIENNGEMISTGKIINKGSVDIFDPSGTFRNQNLLVNTGGPIENGGTFHNYFGTFESTTPIHDYCGSYIVNPSTTVPQVGTIDKCVPVTFTKPVDNWTICENQHPTFEWKESNIFASQTYKFWLTPGLTPEFIVEEAQVPSGGNYNAWSYQISYDLPRGAYDYYVARTDSAGTVVSLPDVQRMIVKASDGNCPYVFESITFGDPITILISSNFNIGVWINSGSLQIDDLVVMVNDGTKMYEKSINTQTIGGYSNESLKLLVNPKGENGVLVDNRLSSLEHNNEVYSFKYGGDCDANGAVTLVEAKTFSDKSDWKCTITFDYLGDKPPEPTYNPLDPAETNDPPPIYPDAYFVLPSDIVVEAIDDNGAVVNYPTVTATDMLNANVPVQCSPSSNGVFPVGVTIVKCSAIKDQNYPFEDEFRVTVKPPPSIFDLPYDMVVDATSDNGAVVDYPAVTGIDPTPEMSGEVLIAECDPASGSVFSVGHNTVFCSATDAEGNFRTGIFGVTVIPYAPPLPTPPEPISEPPKMESGPFTPPPTPVTPTPTPEPRKQVPTWIKNNAEWWAQGAIDDEDFVGGIQFLIKEKIIDIPDLPEQASATAEAHVPNWIKNNAGWWADGLISEDEFVNGLKWLVENGIIRT